MRAVCASFLFFALTAAASAADARWICVADLSTGFKYMDGHWQIVTFNVAKHRYIISQDATETYHFIQVGESVGTECALGAYAANYIYCATGFDRATINTQTLRFSYSYFAGYVQGVDSDSADTPMVEIGTCSPL